MSYMCYQIVPLLTTWWWLVIVRGCFSRCKVFWMHYVRKPQLECSYQWMGTHTCNCYFNFWIHLDIYSYLLSCVCSYFQDGLKTIEHFHCYIEELVVQLGRLKQKQDAERRNLVELRDVLRNFMSSYKEVKVCSEQLFPLYFSVDCVNAVLCVTWVTIEWSLTTLCHEFLLILWNLEWYFHWFP